MFEVGKEYKTKGGHTVRIYATDGGLNSTNIHGAYLDPTAGWSSVVWNKDGHVHGRCSEYSLVPPIIVSDAVVQSYLTSLSDGGMPETMWRKRCLAAAIEQFLKENNYERR